jgi:hypothetical protein
MEFDQIAYIAEMKAMVNRSIDRLTQEKPDFEIFTVSLWTDANAAASSISFDSKGNSDKKVGESNAWNEKYYKQYIKEGDFAQAKLFEPTNSRNCNPADFELRDFEEIDNESMPDNWEDETDGECWDILDPILQKIGEYAFEKLSQRKINSDFELAVNGRLDWYEFTWPKK